MTIQQMLRYHEKEAAFVTPSLRQDLHTAAQIIDMMQDDFLRIYRLLKNEMRQYGESSAIEEAANIAGKFISIEEDAAS